jgi:hypothetical protein
MCDSRENSRIGEETLPGDVVEQHQLLERVNAATIGIQNRLSSRRVNQNFQQLLSVQFPQSSVQVTKPRVFRSEIRGGGGGNRHGFESSDLCFEKFDVLVRFFVDRRHVHIPVHRKQLL